MLLAVAQRKLGRLEEASVYVGGNPCEPDAEWSYMAPFSPSDVIAEYTRPARIIRGGVVTERPALSERHHITVPGYGEFEAFLTDGLRSVLETIEATEMAEYTLRWPGHIDHFLRWRTADARAEAELMDAWRFDAARPEFTWLKVEACGPDAAKMQWELVDQGRHEISSMARTTGGVTIACAELLLADSNLLRAGVHPPEALDNVSISKIISQLCAMGIQIDGPTPT
jgi:saccharopine dehydrogenase-like NADP-dependent oxidoreductase